MKLNRLTRLLMLSGTLLASSWSAQATVVSLTTAGASGTINGATYTQVPQQPTGSGFINSFVRIGANQNIVQAYNTTADGVFDNGNTNTFNHEITVGQVGIITIGANNVLRFLLDINQTGSAPLLNLDEVQIFLSTTPNQSVTTFTGGVLNLASSALVYRMDAGVDSLVTLNYALNSGSGSGDMTLDILATALDPAFLALGLTTTTQKNSAYIYLYSKFGSSPNNNNDGFEEWAHAVGRPIGEPPCVPTPTNGFCGQNQIPEPASLPLVAAGLLGAWWAIRRRLI